MAEKKTPEEIRNYFAELYAVNVNDRTEKKNGLTYLSWAWAWAEIKKRHPDAFYTVYENASGWNYHTDGRTCWVKTGVTVQGVEHIEYLPVMDFRNASIPYDKVTSYDVNKAIQRSLTKACARHGLGLYVYAGEDLPEEAAETAEQQQAKPAPAAKKQTAKKPEPKPEPKKEPDPEPEPEKTEAAEANGSRRKPAKQTDPITAEMAASLVARCTGEGVDVVKLCELYKVASVPKMCLAHLRNINENWDKVKERCGKQEG